MNWVGTTVKILYTLLSVSTAMHYVPIVPIYVLFVNF